MTRQHPSERNFDAWSVTPGTFFRLGQRCCGLFGNLGPTSTSTSITTSENVTATDEGVVSGGDVTKAGDFSDLTNISQKTTLSDSAKLVGVDVSGANVQGGLNVTTSDPGIVRDALAAIQASTQNFSGTLSDVINGANANAAAQNSKVLDKISELSLSRQTDGASVAGKNIVWILLGVAAAVVLAIWAWRAS